MENLPNTSQEPESGLAEEDKLMFLEELRAEAEQIYQEAMEESRNISEMETDLE